MIKETKSNIQSFLGYCAIVVLVLSSCMVVTAPSAEAQEQGTCGKIPNQNEYYHGDTFGLYMAPPLSAGGSYTDFVYSPTSESIPNAIQIADPVNPSGPEPYFDFLGYRGSRSVLMTGSYRDANGVSHDVACTVTYSVRVCQGFNQYGPYEKPCYFSGGGGGGGGGEEPGFSLSCSPFSRSVQRGDSTTYTISVTVIGGFSGSVSIYINTPPGVTAEARNVSAGGSVLIPVTATAAAQLGIHTLTFSGISESGSSADAYCDLVVQEISTPYATPYTTPAYTTPYATPSYVTPYTTPAYVTPYATPSSGNLIMNCAPPLRTVNPGDSTTYSVQVTAAGSVTGAVGVSVSISPTGANAPMVSVIPASINPPGSSTVVATTVGSTNPGSYTITITATDVSQVERCDVKLEVNRPSCPPNCPSPYATPYMTPIYTTPPISPNLSLSDKDIIAVNGVPNPNASSANNISDIPTRINFKAGDVVRFRIAMFNSGTAPIANVTITDTMFHVRAPSNPRVTFDGCSGSHVVTGGGIGFTFRINGSIDPSSICSVSFDGIITAPPGVAEGIDRFQNVGVISGDNISHTVKTPFLLFTIGKVPTKEEVAP